MPIARNRELRRRCDDRLRQLTADGDLPDPFVLTDFLDRVAGRRGRRVELHAMSYAPGSVCGMWLRLAEIDVIVYARATPLLEEHIVLHEVAHMLCGHRGESDSDDQALRVLMPDLDPVMVRSLLGRSSYTAIEEHEAELLATLILQRVADRRPAPPAAVEAELAPQMDRLNSAFRS